MTIRIFDTQKVVLHKEKFSTEKNTAKPYNLAQLPNGIYEVELEDEYSFRRALIKLTSHGLELLEKEDRKTFKPFVKSEGKSIALNFLMVENDFAKVTIINSSGEEIFSNIFKNIPTLHKQFDLSKYGAGEYLVRVQTEDRVFRNVVNLK